MTAIVQLCLWIIFKNFSKVPGYLWSPYICTIYMYIYYSMNNVSFCILHVLYVTVAWLCMYTSCVSYCVCFVSGTVSIEFRVVRRVCYELPGVC